MSHTVGIVGHIDRADMIDYLADRIRPEVISIDNGALGCEGNHQAVWRKLITDYPDSKWTVVLEDDALPIARFNRELEHALRVAPAQIVSLYLGRQRPVECQRPIAKLIQNGCDAHWIIANRLMHAVAVAVRTSVVPAMLHWINEHASGYPIDEAISAWAGMHRHPVAYTWPSLVDHADTPTVIAQHHDGADRAPGRHAWRTGHRGTWCRTTASLHLETRYSHRR